MVSNCPDHCPSPFVISAHSRSSAQNFYEYSWPFIDLDFIALLFVLLMHYVT